MDLLATAVELIAGEGLQFVKDKAKQQEGVLRVLAKLGFNLDAPLANEFDAVYAHTLVVYGIGKPKPILDFFRHQFIKDAFERSFEQRDLSILEEETENFLDWNEIGKELTKLDYDPRREFMEFREQFTRAAQLTRTVQDVLADHKLEDIQDSIDMLPDLEDLRQQLQPIAEGIEAFKLGRQKRENATPFVLTQLDISSFTGRKKELRQLEKQILDEGKEHIAGIVGVGGVGKSALAIHFAQQHKDRFPDGVIGLRVDKGSVDLIAQRFAWYMGEDIDPKMEFSASEVMQFVFRNRKALLIFDNADSVTIEALHPQSLQTAVIVTTRNKEVLRRFGIPEPEYIELQQFSYEETKELLRLIIDSHRIESEEEEIKTIHRLVGGLPLALRIVGGTLADQFFFLQLQIMLTT